MSRRLVGNDGVDHLGVAREKKKPSKRTKPSTFVLGPEVKEMLRELAAAKRVKRSECLRTLIVQAFKEMDERRRQRWLIAPTVVAVALEAINDDDDEE